MKIPLEKITSQYQQDNRRWNVVETDVEDGTIVRNLINLSTGEANNAYNQIINFNSVRQGYNTVKMVEIEVKDKEQKEAL